MRHFLLLSVFLSALCGNLLAEKPKILFDTDMTGDVDDVLATSSSTSSSGPGSVWR